MKNVLRVEDGAIISPGGGAGNLIYLPALYSEEEREVGVWTDGKPLYQKTCHYVESSEVIQADYDFSNLNTDRVFIISKEMKLGSAAGGIWVSEDQYYDGTYNRWTALDENNKIFGVGARGWKFTEVIITIQYTKTTDQPGSGTWTPEGQLAHHYSTSEKIVGTWIDGSTVYEKTFNVGSISAGNDVRVPAQLNIAKVIRLSGNAHSSNYNQWVEINIALQYITAYIVTAQYLASSQEINIHTGTDFTLDECYITLQYTKTT